MGKARTKAAKLRAKVGRPRLDGSREPNGRLSRSGREPADVIALSSRMRHHGLTLAQAQDQKAETFIGRLNLRGEITEEQYQALVNFKLLDNEYRKALQSGGAYYEGTGGAGSEATEQYVEWVEGVVERYGAVTRAIAEGQRDNRAERLIDALGECVLKDCDAPELIGAVRLVSNVLVRHARLDSATR